MKYLINLALPTMALLTALSATASEQEENPTRPYIDDNGTVYLPEVEVPLSPLLSEDSREAMKKRLTYYLKGGGSGDKKCGSLEEASLEESPAIRQCMAENFYVGDWYKSLLKLYDFNIEPQTMGGVYTEVFTPAAGIADKNRDRVLINLHGGGFRGGARTNSHLESAPIATIGKIKVISVDYRMAPEYTFPAASDDVVAVYRQVLKKYQPENIGIYGCSAGGMLTAEAIARFQKEKLPLPAAIGLFCASAHKFDGDSKDIGWLMMGLDLRDNQNKSKRKSYFDGIDTNDPLVTPAMSDKIMAKFPPSLLISSSRDAGLSGVIATHRQLTRLGVKHDLQLWEGVDHAFIYDPNLPESREAYNITVQFFEEHLGR